MRYIALLVLFGSFVCPAEESAQKSPLIEVSQPTIIAFFSPVTQAESDRAPGTNEALNDFQFYATKLRPRLQEREIKFHEIYAHSFRIRTGRVVKHFRPQGDEVGYYLVAPGKKPRVEYGVMTDADLLEIADEYFRKSK